MGNKQSPERIWATTEEDGNRWTRTKPAYDYMTEYVRADLVAPAPQPALDAGETRIRTDHRTQMDWQQVALNGGPPCFFDDGKGWYCGRAEHWAGHGVDHPFIPLAALVAEATLARWRGEMLESAEKECEELHRSAAAVPKLVGLLENAGNAIRGGLSLRRQIDCSCKGKEYTCVNCRLVDRLRSAGAKIDKALTTVNQTGGER